MGRLEEHEDSHEKVESSIGSVLFSVLLVALALGFVFGFKYYLARKTYRGPDISEYADDSSSVEAASDHIELEKDYNFHYKYVMIQGLNGKELWASKEPGEKDKSSKDLKEGQILRVKERGYLDEKLYYLLENGLYLKDDKSIMPLKEYIELEGYLSITYINASGVRLRKWADFDADNIVGSVYVGDKVSVKAKVITVTDTPAFVTTDGYYITTDSRYLNDHTNVAENDTK